MKKFLIVPLLMVSLLLASCGPTLNQLKGEEAYYAARVAMSKQAGSAVLFEMTANDITKPIILENVAALRVFTPPASGNNDSLTPYIHRDYVQPWLNVLGAAVPWLGVWGVSSAIIGGMKDMGTTTNMNVNGTGNSGSIVGPTHNAVSGTGHYVGGTIDTTHPAQVVNPVIVDPVIVDPVIVQPSYPPVP